MTGISYLVEMLVYNPSYRARYLTFNVAISIWVITSEQNILLVAVDHDVKCTDGFHGWAVTEIFPVDLALISPSQDMVFGMQVVTESIKCSPDCT